MIIENGERFTLTVTQVGKLLGIGRNQAYKAVRQGTIPSIRIGPKRIVVPKAAFYRWLEQAGAAK